MEITKNDNGYIIKKNAKQQAFIQTFRNLYHTSNCYIDFDPDDLQEVVIETVFKLISQTEKSPLQAMVSSDEKQKTELLSSNGFKKVRVCHEIEVTKNELKNDRPLESNKLLKTPRGQSEYIICCKLLFDHYKETHESINPLSASFESFIDDIPSDVLYAKDKDGIKHAAFIEESDVAYICSNDKATIEGFAHAVVNMMFSSNDNIYFEADDVDWCAMALKNIFTVEPSITFDTWIFEGKWM